MAYESVPLSDGVFSPVISPVVPYSVYRPLTAEPYRPEHHSYAPTPIPSPYGRPGSSPYPQPAPASDSQPEPAPYSQPEPSPYSQPALSPYGQPEFPSHVDPQYSQYGQHNHAHSSQDKMSQQPFVQSRPIIRQRPPRTWTENLAHKVQRLWLWEIAACWLAMASHVTMIALLIVYHDAKVSAWTAPWTFNSNVAFFITIIKGACLSPVASCLGQLKWRRFWGSNPLSDMEIFDEASRGVFGSAKLLFHLRFHHFASAGALITLVALSMDTLAQNVIGTIQKLEVTEGIATLPRSTQYNTFLNYGTGKDLGDPLPWPSMVSAINYGMSYTGSLFWAGSSLPPICQTGNCTYGTYQSLVVESRCINVTERLDWGSYPDVYYLPGGPYLRKADGMLNISTTTTYPPTNRFGHIGPLIVQFQAIANPFFEQPTAIQCVVYWAVAKFAQTKVSNYVLDDPITELWTNTTTEAETEYGSPDNIIIHPPECWVNGTEIKNATDERCEYWIHPTAQTGLQNFMMSSNLGMAGRAEYHSNYTGWDLPKDEGLYVDTLFANAVYDAMIEAPRNESYEIMERVIHNTTIMMTQGVRQLPGVDRATFPTNGTVYAFETFYKIEFSYLGATHFVVGSTILFLGFTIYLTKSDHPWKTSPLPLLFHGLDENDRNTVAEVPHMVGMREAAQQMRVKMTVTPVGQRLATSVTTSGYERTRNY